MAKHKDHYRRDAVALGPEPALALILKPEDAQLFEKLLMFYANERYFGGDGRNAHRWRGFALGYKEARDLAAKIRRLRRG